MLKLKTPNKEPLEKFPVFWGINDFFFFQLKSKLKRTTADSSAFVVVLPTKLEATN